MLAIIIFVGSHLDPHKSTRRTHKKTEAQRGKELPKCSDTSWVLWWAPAACLGAIFPSLGARTQIFLCTTAPQKKKKNHLLFFLKDDFLGGPVVKNLSSSAGDSGSISDQGMKIPCAMGQLSP